MVLNMLATPFRQEMLSNPDYQARVLAREQEKAAKRKAEVEEREIRKKEAREKRKEEWKAFPGMTALSFYKIIVATSFVGNQNNSVVSKITSRATRTTENMTYKLILFGKPEFIYRVNKFKSPLS